MTFSAQFFVSSLVIVAILHMLLGATAYLILLERKIASWAQDRIGPNRVGLTFGILPHGFGKGMLGLGQPLADGIKFLMKEDYDPKDVEKALFYLAPALAVIPALIGWAVVPWGGEIFVAGFELGPIIVESGTAIVTAANINIGVIFILAIGSLAVYGVVLGGWASNNKYSFLGGLRATAQMLSYEIPMGLIVLCVLLMAGSAHAETIVAAQAGYHHYLIPQWFLFMNPVAAILFFVCILAECNRAPFDMAEAESELVGGYHTEYSSMKFALFFLGEYMHMITGAAFITILFLGGWDAPMADYGWEALAMAVPAIGEWGAGVHEGALLPTLALVFFKAHVFLIKVAVLLAIMMWVRWTLPRFRFDQLMKLAWMSLIPITLGMVLITGLFVYLGWEGYIWAGTTGFAFLVFFIVPFMPKGPNVNRRIPLRGSRFSPEV